ncbi:hypothetical protein ACGF07_08500 [Kitasatospora sp. NPDC048194]|uniref:hypothetical protein n=1 Tax=Kitasatospora sp. NPDC048194 TaxID=3364045 RepID=UPI0037165A15
MQAFIDHARTFHHRVARRADAGRLGLHGWFYEVYTGAVRIHRPGTDLFLPL